MNRKLKLENIYQKKKKKARQKEVKLFNALDCENPSFLITKL